MELLLARGGTTHGRQGDRHGADALALRGEALRSTQRGGSRAHSKAQETRHREQHCRQHADACGDRASASSSSGSKATHRSTSTTSGRGLALELRRARLRHVRLHDTRHSYASALIACGCDLREVADRLGHRDSGVTSRVYAHALQKRSTPQLMLAARGVHARGNGLFVFLWWFLPAARNCRWR